MTEHIDLYLPRDHHSPYRLNERGQRLDSEICQAIEGVLRDAMREGASPRDVQSIAQGVVSDICLGELVGMVPGRDGGGDMVSVGGGGGGFGHSRSGEQKTMSKTTRIIALVVAILLVLVTGGLLINHCVDQVAIQREIDDWNWGTFGITCPPMQLRCGPSLTKQQCSDTWSAANHLQLELGRQLYNQAPQSNKPVVVVHARHKLATDDLLCAGKSLLGHLGRTYRYPMWSKPIARFDIVVCYDKLRASKALRNPAQRGYEKIKAKGRLGNVGATGHELLHTYTGDRRDHAHPRVGAGLLAADPETMTVGPVVKGVFARIDKQCGGGR